MGLFSKVVKGVTGAALGYATGGGFGAVAGGISGLMGSDKAGTASAGGQTSVNGYVIGDQFKTQYDDLLAKAYAQYQKPYENYTGEAVAPFTQDQNDAFAGIRGLQGKYQGLLDSSSQLALNAANFDITDPATLQKYMNPYTQNVIDIAKREKFSDYDKLRGQLDQQSAGMGAYGGNRAALMQSELTRNTEQGLDDLQYKGLADAYDKGMSSATADRQSMMQNALGLVDVAGGAQSQNLAGINALMTSGNQQQALDQSQDTFDYNEFLAEQGYDQSQISNYTQFLQSWLPKQGTVDKYEPTNSSSENAAGLGSLLTSALGSSGATDSINGGISNLWSSVSGLFGFADGGMVDAYADGGPVGGISELDRRRQAYRDYAAKKAEEGRKVGEDRANVFKQTLDDVRWAWNDKDTPLSDLEYNTLKGIRDGSISPKLGGDAKEVAPIPEPVPVSGDPYGLDGGMTPWPEEDKNGIAEIADDATTKPAAEADDTKSLSNNKSIARMGIAMLNSKTPGQYYATIGQGYEAYLDSEEKEEARKMAQQKLLIEGQKATADLIRAEGDRRIKESEAAKNVAEYGKVTAETDKLAKETMGDTDLDTQFKENAKEDDPEVREERMKPFKEAAILKGFRGRAPSERDLTKMGYSKETYMKDLKAYKDGLEPARKDLQERMANGEEVSPEEITRLFSTPAEAKAFAMKYAKVAKK